MKKFLTFILVLAMVLSVSSFAMAAETVNDAAGLKTALENGGEYVLGANIILTEAITIPAGKTVTLDLAGYDITGSGIAHLIKIANTATLNIYDNSADESGVIELTDGPAGYTATIYVEGNLNLYSGTISLVGSYSIAYAVDVRPNAWGTAYTEGTVFHMYDGTIKSDDGAIRVASTSADGSTGPEYENVSATFIMDDGKIEAAYDGIFIQQSNTYYDKLIVDINNGEIDSENYAIRVYVPSDPAVDTVGDVTEPINVSIDNTEVTGIIKSYLGTADEDKMDTSITNSTFTEDPSALLGNDALVAKVTDNNDSSQVLYAVGKAAIEEAAEEAAKKSGAEKVTVTVTKGDVAFDKDDLPGGVTVKNAGGGNVTVDGTTPDPSFGVVVPTPVPEKPASSGSGISVKYNGGNSFSTSKSDVPTGVEIDGVPVTFNGTGSNFSVGCISSDAKWVTVRWNSTSVTTNFTPDGLVECTTVSIPKTGGMSIWAAIAQFLGF